MNKEQKEVSDMRKRDEMPPDLTELIKALTTIPDEYRAAVAPAVDALVDSTMRRRRILGLVQDALGQLRLDMKYLMFDLESTRRERDDALAKLED